MGPAEELRKTFRGRVLEGEPMSRHTTWRVGGPADFFLVPADRPDLLEALRFLECRGIPWIPVGAGSNLLVRDGGIRGAIVHTGGLRELEFSGDQVRAGGGLPLMTLIRETVGRGLAGLERLAGIPGTVGGGVAMNAGAGGQEMAGVIRSVILAGPDGEEEWDARRLRFGYRTSGLPAGRMVAGARLEFSAAEPKELEEEIRRRLGQRRSAQGVGGPNAGSVFKNPEGLAAWRLIDRAGLRGAAVGGAQVSEKHTNFIVNRGNATATEILELMDRIRREVLGITGIELEPEVRIVGED